MKMNGLAVTVEFLKQNSSKFENNYTEKFESRTVSEFSKWFSRRERKLVTVSSATTKAHLMVAKDGSGNFKMVKRALSAAAKRRSKTMCCDKGE